MVTILWLHGHPWNELYNRDEYFIATSLLYFKSFIATSLLYFKSMSSFKSPVLNPQNVFPANDMNKSLTSFTYTYTCKPQQHFLWKTECHFLNPEARGPLVLIWGAKTGNSGKLLPLPPWTATDAADRGQSLFRAPLMHCSWNATASSLPCCGNDPRASSTTVKCPFNKGIS